MIQCAECKKDFEPKKSFAKFCSDICRVRYNRKHPLPKKDAVSLIQMKVLYDSMLDLMSNIKYAPITEKSYDAPSPLNRNEIDEFGTHQSIKILKSFEVFLRMKRECENEEDWELIKEDILAAENLTSKQKSLLTTLNR